MADILCGKQIKWSIRLIDGFDKDTVLFIVGLDTLDIIEDATSMGNSCTDIFLTAYKEEGKLNLYLKNLPSSFNSIKENVILPKDSINVDK